MNELIKITKHGENQVVSARELHEFLGATERFSYWIDRNLKYGFVEGLDYSPLTFLHPQNKVEMQDYALTLDTAKQLAMMSRSDKGLEARRYFIECEKKLKEVQVSLPDLSTHIKSVEAYLGQLKANEVLKEAQRLAEVEAQKQKEIAQLLAPKATYTDKILTATNSWLTTTIADELGMSAIKLNQELVKRRVQRKVDGKWVLYAEHQGKGYTDTKTFDYVKPDRTLGTKLNTVWTERGRYFIHNLLNPVLITTLKPVDE